jgi:hypothetical protein
VLVRSLARLMGMASNRGAIVVPAFELVGGHQMEPYIGEHVVKSLVASTKENLRKAYKAELVGAFKWVLNSTGVRWRARTP